MPESKPLHVLLPRATEVQQHEIDHLIGMRNHMIRLQRIYNKEAAALLERLAAGAQVEAGNHTAELEQITAGPLRTVRLVLR